MREKGIWHLLGSSAAADIGINYHEVVIIIVFTGFYSAPAAFLRQKNGQINGPYIVKMHGWLSLCRSCDLLENKTVFADFISPLTQNETVLFSISEQNS